MFNQTKKGDHRSSSRGRGRGSNLGRARGHEHGRHSKNEKEDEEKKLFDISKTKWYNFQKMGHFVDECYANKKIKAKKRRQML